jgi:GPH family glycoside/pentoside/hexuronide:cation symporter
MVAKYGKKELATFGSICSLVAAGALFIVTPDNTGLDLVLYVISQLIYSLGLGIYSTVSWAMMGDAIDYNEWKTGNREEGVVYAMHSFFRKLAQGLGPAVAIFIMGFYGYVENDVNEYGEAIINIELLSFDVGLNMRWLVAILFLVSALLQFIGLALVYNLDKKTLAKMNADLGRDVEADDVLTYTTAEDNDNLA